jgi:hypothetical protein
MVLKSSHWSCLKDWFKGYTFCFTKFLSDPLLEHSKGMNEPLKKRSNDLEKSKFRQQVQSLVRVPPLRRVTFKFWEMPFKKCLRGNLSTKKYFFPTNFELCAKFCGGQSKPG